MARTPRWALSLLCALGLLVAGLPGAPRVDAASSIVVTIEGPNGRLVARAANRTVELSLAGRPTVVFRNAQIVVTRGRVAIAGRSPDETLVAWSNRVSGGGGVGVLIRTVNRRFPERIGYRPTSVRVDGDAPAISVRRRR